MLYADLSSITKSISELPAPHHYTLVAAFTFTPTLLDFPEGTHSPELVFDAVAERGRAGPGKRSVT